MKLVLCVGILAIISYVAGQSYSSRHTLKSAIENDVEFGSYDVSKSSEGSRTKQPERTRFRIPERQKPSEKSTESKTEKPKEEEASGEEEAATPRPSTLSRIISSVAQLPRNMFRAISKYVTSTRPISRLRDEMSKLNISYPSS